MEILIIILSLFAEHTKTDVLDFVANDRTNQIQYSEDFDCVQFSETLMHNAELRGFETSGVFVIWKDAGGNLAFHEFVQFEATDGIVWIEPQNDTEYRISEIGEKLCDLNGNCVSEPLISINIEN